jgi:hypothetical protein
MPFFIAFFWGEWEVYEFSLPTCNCELICMKLGKIHVTVNIARNTTFIHKWVLRYPQWCNWWFVFLHVIQHPWVWFEHLKGTSQTTYRGTHSHTAEDQNPSIKYFWYITFQNYTTDILLTTLLLLMAACFNFLCMTYNYVTSVLDEKSINQNMQDPDGYWVAWTLYGMW